MQGNSTHNLVRVSVALPHLCIVCDDYIVTPKCTARQCFTCGHLFHASCVVKADRCAGSLSPSSGDGDSDILAACEASASVALSEQLLTNWTLEQVLQWLVVVGLSRYTTLFLSYNINGETLPSLLKPPSPLDDIKDSFARCSLKGAVMTLIGELPCPGDRLVTPKDPDTKSAASLPHTDLRIRNFTSELACCVCGLPLLGLVSQGYQCDVCGSVFHRVCRVLTEEHPPCPGRQIVDASPQPPTHPDSDVHQGDYKLPTAVPVIKHTYFTVPLDKQITDSNNVPVFLSTATRIFEQLAIFNAQETTQAKRGLGQQVAMVDCVETYRASAEGRDLHDIELTYANRLPTVLEANAAAAAATSTEHRLVKLAQIIKRFLRELPEPVIPTDFYESTVSLAGQTDPTQSGRPADLEALLSSLPKRSFATLRHVMQHVGFILCHQRVLKVRLSSRLTRPDERQKIDRLDDPRLVLNIFSQSLLRPPWRQIVKLASADNNYKHLLALERVFEYFVRPHESGAGGAGTSLPLTTRSVSSYECYAELLAQSGGGVGLATRLPPLANAPSTSLDPPTALSIARNKKDLEERDWYWGDISRSEVSEIMLGQPDGAFLVRDASAGSASAFTLTERRNFTTILFRIYHRGDVFDITNPPSPGFPLVSSLVAHYQQQGALTGVEVPTPRLLHPVTRRNFIDLPPSHLASAASSGQIVQGLLAALKNTSVELTRFQVQVSDVNRKLTELIHKMATTTNQMRALGLAQDWLVKTNYQFSRNQQALPGVSQDALAKYVSIFEKRLAWTRATRLEKRRQHNSLLDRTRQVSESQVVLCSKQHQVSRRMQEIRRELKRRGVSDEVIIAFDTVVTDGAPSQPPPPSTAVVPASDGHPTSLKRSDWFADVSRQLAESILSNKPSGTFLIRPSAVPNRFALSVRTGTSIQHCLIYCLHNRYGFSESSLPFLSLEELVAHYRVSSLAQHNALLDTTLTLPAFAPSSPP